MEHSETLKKDVELDAWADRMGASAEVKAELRARLLSAPDAVKEWLTPREDGDKMVFELTEGIVVGRKSAMRQITVTRARPKLSELVSKVTRGKRVIIAQKGKRGEEKAVLVGFREFEGMKRQLEFRRLLDDMRTQARASGKIPADLDDAAALELADQVVQEVRRERRARCA